MKKILFLVMILLCFGLVGSVGHSLTITSVVINDTRINVLSEINITFTTTINVPNLTNAGFDFQLSGSDGFTGFNITRLSSGGNVINFSNINCTFLNSSFLISIYAGFLGEFLTLQNIALPTPISPNTYYCNLKNIGNPPTSGTKTLRIISLDDGLNPIEISNFYDIGIDIPIISTVKLISTNCPSCDYRLFINAQEGLFDLDGCFVGSTFAHNDTSGNVEINITDTTTSGTIWCNDTGNLNVSYPFNFTMTDLGIKSNTTVTTDATSQTFYRSDTLTNNAAGQINYSINQTNITGGSVVSGNSFIGTLNNGDIALLNTNWQGDWITESTLTGWSIDTDWLHTLLMQKLNRTRTDTALASLPNSTSITTTITDRSEVCWNAGTLIKTYTISASGTQFLEFNQTGDCISESSSVQNLYMKANQTTTINTTASNLSIEYVDTLKYEFNGLNYSTTKSGTFFNTTINSSSVPDNNYTIKLWANFTNMSTFRTVSNSNKWVVVDNTEPSIYFVSPSTNDTVYYTMSHNYIMANISASDTYYSYLNISLYNSTGSLVNSTLSSYVNFTDLLNETYFINATAYDLAGNENFTETRFVFIDSVVPNITDITVQTTANTGNTIYFYANCSDSVSGVASVSFWVYTYFDSGATYNGNITTTFPVTGYQYRVAKYMTTAGIWAVRSVYCTDNSGNTITNNTEYNIVVTTLGGVGTPSPSGGTGGAYVVYATTNNTCQAGYSYVNQSGIMQCVKSTDILNLPSLSDSRIALLTILIIVVGIIYIIGKDKKSKIQREFRRKADLFDF